MLAGEKRYESSRQALVLNLSPSHFGAIITNTVLCAVTISKNVRIAFQSLLILSLLLISQVSNC
jgi:hypothetical protein